MIFSQAHNFIISLIALVCQKCNANGRVKRDNDNDDDDGPNLFMQQSSWRFLMEIPNFMNANKW